LINFRTDEGPEYLGTVSTFLKEHGITHEQTSPYSSSFNGVAERINRTLMDKVRTAMLNSNLPAPFWGEALHTTTKVCNRLPTFSLAGNMSPHEAWFGNAPSLEHLQVFVCLAFYSIKHPRSKVQSRARRCCFLGYEGTTQFRVFDPATNKIVRYVRNIDFIEDAFLGPKEFTKVPYSERPLLLPEPRNCSEEDDEIEDDELDESFWDDEDPHHEQMPELAPDVNVPDVNVPDINIPRPPYLPAPQAAPTNLVVRAVKGSQPPRHSRTKHNRWPRPQDPWSLTPVLVYILAHPTPTIMLTYGTSAPMIRPNNLVLGRRQWLPLMTKNGPLHLTWNLHPYVSMNIRNRSSSQMAKGHRFTTFS
jgi:hypothetical protein